MATERQYREQIVRYGHTLHKRGFVAATDGNLSIRLDKNRILATPTCMSKGEMRPADMVIVNMEGRLLSGRRNVSSEIGMHLLIYRLRPDVKGVVHAHPPTATGYAAAGIALNQPLVCEVVIGLEDGDGGALCADRAGHASTRSSATPGRRRVAEISWRAREIPRWIAVGRKWSPS